MLNPISKLIFFSACRQWNGRKEIVLKENGMVEFINKLRSKNVYLNELQFKYNPGASNPFAKLYCYGMEDIYSEEEYYENIHQNLIAANLSWLHAVASKIRMPMEAVVELDEDGNFISDTIKMTITINAPRGLNDVVPYLYPRIKPFILLNELVDTVQVRGYKGFLQYIRLNLTIDTKRFTALLNKEKVNNTIREQWLASINNYVRENKNQDIFENQFQVVNGRINVKYKTELIDQYFALANKGY